MQKNEVKIAKGDGKHDVQVVLTEVGSRKLRPSKAKSRAKREINKLAIRV